MQPSYPFTSCIVCGQCRCVEGCDEKLITFRDYRSSVEKWKKMKIQCSFFNCPKKNKKKQEIITICEECCSHENKEEIEQAISIYLTKAHFNCTPHPVKAIPL